MKFFPNAVKEHIEFKSKIYLKLCQIDGVNQKSDIQIDNARIPLFNWRKEGFTSLFF